jgi:hypothetical protein
MRTELPGWLLLALLAFLLLLLLIPATAGAQSPADKLVSYSTDKKSVQYVVIDLAEKVGLGYNWHKSFTQTNPLCRRFVNSISITNQPFDRAITSILKPVGLRYQIEEGKVVLYPQ